MNYIEISVTLESCANVTLYTLLHWFAISVLDSCNNYIFFQIQFT